MMFPKWLIEIKTQEIFKVKSVVEENLILSRNPEQLYTVCDHEPTQKDIDYLVFGITLTKYHFLVYSITGRRL